MAKIIVTPIAESGVAPYEVEGELTHKWFNTKNWWEAYKVYYINGESYPAEIVTVISNDYIEYPRFVELATI